jgi:hypothetical protein
LGRTEKPVFVVTDEDGVFEGYEIGETAVFVEPTAPVERPPELKRDKFNTRRTELEPKPKRTPPPPKPKREAVPFLPELLPEPVQLPPPKPEPIPPAIVTPPPPPEIPQRLSPIEGISNNAFSKITYLIHDHCTNRYISETIGVARETVEQVRCWWENQKRKP